MIASEENHVSPFELDVYWSSGRPRNQALEAHLLACARCAAYLASLDAIDVGRQPLSRANRSRRLRFAWSIAGAVALAAGVAVVAVKRGGDTSEYVGVKGTPAVLLLVHRAGETRIWDARSPLRPGDALALRVACEGFSHVSVVAPARGSWTRLSDGACTNQDSPLPFTLIVDSEPGDERVAVVLSRERLDDHALARAIAETQQTWTAWVADFVLPKEVQ